MPHKQEVGVLEASGRLKGQSGGVYPALHPILQGELLVPDVGPNDGNLVDEAMRQGEEDPHLRSKCVEPFFRNAKKHVRSLVTSLGLRGHNPMHQS